MYVLLGIFVILTALFAGFSIVLLNRGRETQEKLKKAQASVAQTSRLMIEKNVELFDQNVSQQKQLAIKDDFIAIASHQLRTPLNEIKWGIGELIDAAKDEEAKKTYNQIFGSARRMEKIVEDLLKFVEVEQGHSRTSMTPYDPDPIIRASAERIAKDFPESAITQKLELAYAKPIESIDPSAFEMIINNLIENAYHYTPKNGTVRVQTRAGEGDNLLIDIEDSGIGIPYKMAENMFVKFRRGEEAIALNKEGSGLGLYIVKTLLVRVGGSITFDSREGVGTTFHLRLPRLKNVTTPPKP